MQSNQLYIHRPRSYPFRPGLHPHHRLNLPFGNPEAPNISLRTLKYIQCSHLGLLYRNNPDLSFMILYRSAPDIVNSSYCAVSRHSTEETTATTCNDVADLGTKLALYVTTATDSKYDGNRSSWPGPLPTM